MAAEPRAVVVMGVSGSGKSTVGRALAEALDWTFFEGDDFHPASNVAKMADGQPLTDADRAPWLDRLHALIKEQLAQGQSLVLACSALKAAYRQRLRAGQADQLCFVFLQGDYDLILKRMRDRRGHYMPADLLQSQFAALEEPQDALAVDAHQAVDQIVEKIKICLEED